MHKKRIAILGSTGVIGTTTLCIIEGNRDKFQVVGLSAHSNCGLLQEQVQRFNPEAVSLCDERAAEEMRRRLKGTGVKVFAGPPGNELIATLPEADLAVIGMVGVAGLRPTLSSIRAGKRVALANKEALVTGGELVMREASAGGTIIPIDSEHSAIFQIIKSSDRREVKRLILTASGGPFLHLPKSRLRDVTVEEALRHPTWFMGKKVTIDSATLMNKGLEVIEARWLFGIDNGNIGVVVHPQSVVHSMVEFVDGAVMAHMGIPDMKVPISYALSFPERIGNGTPALDLAAIGQLTFLEPDPDRFPCLSLARAALQHGGTMPAVLNAANEVAVEAFLRGDLNFLQIPGIIEEVMGMHASGTIEGLDQILAVDGWARRQAREIVRKAH